MADFWTYCKKEIFGITAQTDNGVVGLEDTLNCYGTDTLRSEAAAC